MQHPILFIRSCVFAIIFAVLTTFWGLLLIVVSPLPYSIFYWITARWNITVIGLAKIICGIRYQVIGQENLPDEPIILLSNSTTRKSTFQENFLAPDSRKNISLICLACAKKSGLGPSKANNFKSSPVNVGALGFVACAPRLAAALAPVPPSAEN